MHNYNVYVVESQRSIISCLAEQIKASEASQVLVTGPIAGNFYWNNEEELDSLLTTKIEYNTNVKKCAFCGTDVPKIAIACSSCGRGIFSTNISNTRWKFFGPPCPPTREKMLESLELFANAIKTEPQSQHIYIGPTYEEDVIERLFYPCSAHAYKCSIFILGVYDDPLANLNKLVHAVGGAPHMDGDITNIYSTSDITNQFKLRLAVAQKNNEDIRNLTLLYFEFQECIRLLAHKKDIRHVNKELIFNIEMKLEKEIIPVLFPEQSSQISNVKPWWKFW